MTDSGRVTGEVALASARAVGELLGTTKRLAMTLLDARLLGTVYVADGTRYVTASAVQELAARPPLTDPHPAALVLRVLAAQPDDDPKVSGRAWAGWRQDLPKRDRRAGVAGFWQMRDESAQQVVDEQMRIVVTVRGFVVDVFTARGFDRHELGVRFEPVDIDGAPFTGTVLRLGPGPPIAWLQGSA